MSVYYKFKAEVGFSTVTFDGIHISVGDLKREIFEQKKIKDPEFDLQITDALTKELYSDENQLIAKNASVEVVRVPIIEKRRAPGPGPGPGRGGFSHQYNPRPRMPAMLPPVSTSAVAKGIDLASMEGTEEEKIRAMMIQSTEDYNPAYYQKIRGSYQQGRVPDMYRCFKCQVAGHWIKNCPTNLIGDVKKSTGIPRSFMVTVEGPGVKGALITPEGLYAVPAVDRAAYTDKMQAVPPPPKPQIKKELICTLCDDLITDALLVPCCANSYCDDCIRTALIESEEQECPNCHEKDIKPNSLMANRFLRNAVNAFKNETGYSKPVKEVKRVPSSTLVVDLTDSSSSKNKANEIRKISLDERLENLSEELFPHSPTKIQPDDDISDSKDDKEKINLYDDFDEVKKKPEQTIATIGTVVPVPAVPLQREYQQRPKPFHHSNQNQQQQFTPPYQPPHHHQSSYPPPQHHQPPSQIQHHHHPQQHHSQQHMSGLLPNPMENRHQGPPPMHQHPPPMMQQRQQHGQPPQQHQHGPPPQQNQHGPPPQQLPPPQSQQLPPGFSSDVPPPGVDMPRKPIDDHSRGPPPGQYTSSHRHQDQHPPPNFNQPPLAQRPLGPPPSHMFPPGLPPIIHPQGPPGIQQPPGQFVGPPPFRHQGPPGPGYIPRQRPQFRERYDSRDSRDNRDRRGPLPPRREFDEPKPGTIDDPLKEFERIMKEKDRKKNIPERIPERITERKRSRSRSRSFSPSRRAPSPILRPSARYSRSPSPKRKRPIIVSSSSLRRRRSYSRSISRSPPPRRMMRSRSRSPHPIIHVKRRSRSPLRKISPLRRAPPLSDHYLPPSPPPTRFIRKEKDDYYESRSRGIETKYYPSHHHSGKIYPRSHERDYESKRNESTRDYESEKYHHDKYDHTRGTSYRHQQPPPLRENYPERERLPPPIPHADPIQHATEREKHEQQQQQLNEHHNYETIILPPGTEPLQPLLDLKISNPGYQVNPLIDPDQQQEYYHHERVPPSNQGEITSNDALRKDDQHKRDHHRKKSSESKEVIDKKREKKEKKKHKKEKRNKEKKEKKSRKKKLKDQLESSKSVEEEEDDTDGTEDSLSRRNSTEQTTEQGTIPIESTRHLDELIKQTVPCDSTVISPERIKLAEDHSISETKDKLPTPIEEELAQPIPSIIESNPVVAGENFEIVQNPVDKIEEEVEDTSVKIPPSKWDSYEDSELYSKEDEEINKLKVESKAFEDNKAGEGKITLDVLKKAENNLFQKGISGVSTINRIDTSSRKVYMEKSLDKEKKIKDVETVREAKSSGSNIQVTLAQVSEHEPRTLSSVVKKPITKSRSRSPSKRRSRSRSPSIKSRINDRSRRDERISRYSSPPSREKYRRRSRSRDRRSRSPIKLPSMRISRSPPRKLVVRRSPSPRVRKERYVVRGRDRSRSRSREGYTGEKSRSRDRNRYSEKVSNRQIDREFRIEYVLPITQEQPPPPEIIEKEPTPPGVELSPKQPTPVEESRFMNKFVPLPDSHEARQNVEQAAQLQSTSNSTKSVIPLEERKKKGRINIKLSSIKKVEEKSSSENEFIEEEKKPSEVIVEKEHKKKKRKRNSSSSSERSSGKGKKHKKKKKSKKSKKSKK